jgi:hypothetical protein
VSQRYWLRAGQFQLRNFLPSLTVNLFINRIQYPLTETKLFKTSSLTEDENTKSIFVHPSDKSWSLRLFIREHFGTATMEFFQEKLIETHHSLAS